MKRQQILLSILTFTLLLSTAACTPKTEEEIRARNAERWERLPEATRIEHQRKARFARVFVFRYENRSPYSGSALLRIQQSGHRTVEFVLSEEDARSGNEDVFHLWPSPGSYGFLSRLNEILEEEFNDWNTVLFSHPITMEELIEHWEEVLDLCDKLDILFPVNRLHPIISAYPPADESETD